MSAPANRRELCERLGDILTPIERGLSYLSDGRPASEHITTARKLLDTLQRELYYAPEPMTALDSEPGP